MKKLAELIAYFSGGKSLYVRRSRLSCISGKNTSQVFGKSLRYE